MKKIEENVCGHCGREEEKLTDREVMQLVLEKLQNSLWPMYHSPKLHQAVKLLENQLYAESNK